ncbi:MAG: EAL domain-containing protein [Magnetococcales bacterium]|nr:EAL domain-containing protein [Magnetococcales bacterium]MBF0438498.1 EAL domain-containing protein [Magnetococcales bacterium]
MTILIVDDAPDNIRMLANILIQDHHVIFATSGQQAMESAVANRPDLILLDVMMPEIDGFFVCSWLRENEKTCDIPVIMITAMNDSSAETRGFAAGAVDFLTKPVNPPVVRARVTAHLVLKKQRDELVRLNEQLQEEIMECTRLEEKLREQAEFDELTGLPNRKLFNDRLHQAILMGERKQRNFALMFVDLDRFKWVNDTLGHDAGDTLLIEVARRIKGVVRKSDTVARLGGDEFTVILLDILHESMAELVARKILEELCTPFLLKGEEVVISGSVGVSLFPADGSNAQELVKNADSAMYQAKHSGRNTFRFFSDEIDSKAHQRMKLEGEMRLAIQKEEFFLDYQPKIRLSTGRMTGVEALVRWNHPKEGVLSPNQFIPLAEGSGLILLMGAWVLRTACRDAMCWANEGFADLKLSVNLSALQFREGEKLLQMVEETLQETGFPAGNLELEITESMMIGNMEQVSITLQKLRGMGVNISMDDFGTGYSSLALLKDLPIQVIKIDRSFVRDLEKDDKSADFTSAIISMAKQLGLKVVVEGVETAAQLQILREQGGDEIQGFFFSPPLGRGAFLDLLQGQLPMGGGASL